MKIENKNLKLKVEKNLKLKISKGKTFIYVYCVREENISSSSNNNFVKINCSNLTPITSHVYELSNNTINLFAYDFELLGSVNFTLMYKFKNCSMSYEYMPIPNNLIYSHLNLKSKNKYNIFMNKFKLKGLFKIEFLQLVKI